MIRKLCFWKKKKKKKENYQIMVYLEKFDYLPVVIDFQNADFNEYDITYQPGKYKEEDIKKEVKSLIESIIREYIEEENENK